MSRAVAEKHTLTSKTACRPQEKDSPQRRQKAEKRKRREKRSIRVKMSPLTVTQCPHRGSFEMRKEGE